MTQQEWLVCYDFNMWEFMIKSNPLFFQYYMQEFSFLIKKGNSEAYAANFAARSMATVVTMQRSSWLLPWDYLTSCNKRSGPPIWGNIALFWSKWIAGCIVPKGLKSNLAIWGILDLAGTVQKAVRATIDRLLCYFYQLSRQDQHRRKNRGLDADLLLLFSTAGSTEPGRGHWG